MISTRLSMHRLILSILLIVSTAGCLVSPVRAQTENESGQSAPPLPVPDERFTLTAPLTGTEYELSIFLPDSYRTTGNEYPVLYALDGDAGFDELAARAVRESTAPEEIVVGIGYGLPADDRRPLRLRDYTPASVPGLDGSGGGNEFLEFLLQTVIPDLERRYRVDPDQRRLAGHSLGGFFVLYAVFSNPTSFDGFIAVSPSVAIDDFSGLRSNFDAPSHIQIDLAVAVGGAENPERMIEPIERFVESLRDTPLPGIRLKTAFIEGEDHFSVVDPALAWALTEPDGQ